jgi:uncharacterized protein
MKLLLMLLVALFAVWLWRSRRPPAAPPAAPSAGKRAARQKPAAVPQTMVRCALCGLHLPRQEALPGARAQLYCSAAHRQQAQLAAHPDDGPRAD